MTAALSATAVAIAAPAAHAAMGGRRAQRPTMSVKEATSTVVVTLEYGERFERSIKERGLAASDAKELARVLRRTGARESLRAGAVYEMELTSSGRLRDFTHHTFPGIIYRVTRKGGRLKAETTRIEPRHRVVRVSGLVRGSLQQSLEALGGDPALAFLVSEIFSSELDLLKRAEDGDRIDLLVERIEAGSDLVGYGQVLIGRYERTDGRTLFAFHHITENGDEGYFDEKGRPLRSRRFTIPVTNGHVTSGFGSRRHPILGRARPHWGIDFAAPKGTPIHAVAAGVVESAGWHRQLGRVIVLRHGNGVETKYAHMSYFAKGIRNGQRVRQGQLIGGVGATGLATGSHLHLEARIDGRLVDPATLLLPQPPELSSIDLAALSQRVLDGWQKLESARFEADGGSLIGDGNTLDFNIPNLASVEPNALPVDANRSEPAPTAAPSIVSG